MNTDPELIVVRYLESKRGDLRDLIMVQYAGTVERIARRFAGLEPLEDLVQVGFIGLLNALSKFDPEAGVRFNTYATYLIAGEIKHYLRDRCQTIRQPAWLQELRQKVNKAAASLQSELTRPPTEREIAERIGVSESAVREVFQTQDMLRVASLDSTPTGDDDSESDVERLDAANFCPEQLGSEDRLVLDSAMSQLRDLEREVLQLFHFEMMSQTEIAGKLGISCNYVSHILRQSLSKLRKILSQEDAQDRVLRRQAMEMDYEVIDPLTGAYSEGFFKTRFEEEIHRASCNGTVVGLVVVQFSGLDALRKFYGASSVEEFLADAADFLKDSVRRLDLVCRNGEGGFAMILPGVGDHVNLVKGRLLKKLTSWMNARYAQGSPIRLEVGQAIYPEAGHTTRELFEQMDMVPLKPAA
ncbi:MAG: sigma-70 family RNA polymerase sigma factor [Fimbriimonadaceae bacterium]